jgi:hypothetical protein
MREEQALCTLSGSSDIYNGDSGSPLMVVQGEGEAAHWVAVGIASWTERERPEDTHLPSRLRQGADIPTVTYPFRLVHPCQRLLRLARRDQWRGGGVCRLKREGGSVIVVVVKQGYLWIGHRA